MKSPERCRRCERITLDKPTWRAMSRAEKHTARHTGRAPYKGRGLCQRCYQACWEDGTLADYETRGVPRAIVADEWAMHADRHRTHRENARLLAPRLGMSVDALELAMRRHRREQVAA